MRNAILIVILLVFVLAATFYAITAQIIEPNRIKNSRQLPEPKPKPEQIRYSSHAYASSMMEGSGSVAHIYGTVKNTGGRPICNVKLKVSLTNINGDVKDVTHLYVVGYDPLLPGERKAYDAYLDGFVDISYNRHKVEVVYLELL